MMQLFVMALRAFWDNRLYKTISGILVIYNNRQMLSMCMNWIVPFFIGVFVGQEINDIPRVRPYVEAGVQKVVAIGKEISENAEKKSKTDTQAKPEPKPEAYKPFWKR